MYLLSAMADIIIWYYHKLWVCIVFLLYLLDINCFQYIIIHCVQILEKNTVLRLWLDEMPNNKYNYKKVATCEL